MYYDTHYFHFKFIHLRYNDRLETFVHKYIEYIFNINLVYH